MTFNFNNVVDAYNQTLPLQRIYGSGNYLLWEKDSGEEYIDVIPDDVLPYYSEYLTIEALENGTLTVKTQTSSDTKTVRYNKNNSGWNSISFSDTGYSISFNQGDRIKFKGYYSSSITFYTQNNIKSYGNVLSLLFLDNFSDIKVLNTSEYELSLAGLFRGCLGLTNIEYLVLPLTSPRNEYYSKDVAAGWEADIYVGMFYDCTNLSTPMKYLPQVISDYDSAGYERTISYGSMFFGCSSLISAPRLTSKCINAPYMFSGCTSLVSVPDLMTISVRSCGYMFSGCTSLTKAPALPATTLSGSCYQYMFEGCTSLTSAPMLPATVLTYACYTHMFEGCTSLTSAPMLPATTLTDGCYASMFKGCTNLIQVKSFPVVHLNQYCCRYMFEDCISLLTAPILIADNKGLSSLTGMFRGCTSLTRVPELKLGGDPDYKCDHMFEGCTNLSYIRFLTEYENYASVYTFDIGDSWVNGVSSTGTFVKKTGMKWTHGVNGIPTGWTVIEE